MTDFYLISFLTIPHGGDLMLSAYQVDRFNNELNNFTLLPEYIDCNQHCLIRTGSRP